MPKEIGNEMSPSVKIVGTCHARILEELKLENNAQIIAFFMERASFLTPPLVHRSSGLCRPISYKSFSPSAMFLASWIS